MKTRLHLERLFKIKKLRFSLPIVLEKDHNTGRTLAFQFALAMSHQALRKHDVDHKLDLLFWTAVNKFGNAEGNKLWRAHFASAVSLPTHKQLFSTDMPYAAWSIPLVEKWWRHTPTRNHIVGLLTNEEQTAIYKCAQQARLRALSLYIDSL
jgi:hypothetical protein